MTKQKIPISYKYGKPGQYKNKQNNTNEKQTNIDK